VGEVPVAFVVLRDATADVDEIRRWAAARVPEPAAAPSRVSALPGLPVTAVGKPDKVALRVLATREELAGGLAEAGARLDADGAWCAAHDGVVRLSVQVPDEAAADACRALLERYALPWAVTVGA
jgi:fatty-acyl-CoA synthase